MCNKSVIYGCDFLCQVTTGGDCCSQEHKEWSFVYDVIYSKHELTLSVSERDFRVGFPPENTKAERSRSFLCKQLLPWGIEHSPEFDISAGFLLREVTLDSV